MKPWSLIATLSLGLTLPIAHAQTPDPALKPLAFLTGTWISEVPGDLEEEHWSAPLGSSMIGTFRVVHPDGAAFYELWAIEVEGGHPVFKVRHFTHDLIGREEKSDPVRLDVSQPKPDTVSFSRPGASVSLLYQRFGNDLTCTVRHFKDGRSDEQVFHMHRIP
jgi:hypothetical protein